VQDVEGVGAIDRKKHEIDIMERVLGAPKEEGDDPVLHTEVLDLSVRPWLGGTTTSAVQLTVGLGRDRAEGDGAGSRDDDKFDARRR
jgi:hypothetical protein